jgi:hypothetical protein
VEVGRWADILFAHSSLKYRPYLIL